MGMLRTFNLITLDGYFKGRNESLDKLAELVVKLAGR